MKYETSYLYDYLYSLNVFFFLFNNFHQRINGQLNNLILYALKK